MILIEGHNGIMDSEPFITFRSFPNFKNKIYSNWVFIILFVVLVISWINVNSFQSSKVNTFGPDGQVTYTKELGYHFRQFVVQFFR